MYKRLYNDDQPHTVIKSKIRNIILLIVLSSVSVISFLTYLTLNDVLIKFNKHHQEKSYLIVCYYSLISNNDVWGLHPTQIDPHLCTHVIIGFASIVNVSINLGFNSSIYKDVVNLKNNNPQLKVMLSVGGAGEEMSNRFKYMTQNHAKRKIFIKSVLEVMKSYNFDGLDIDWEYPSWLHLSETKDTDNQKISSEKERIHFVQLIQEIRKAFDRSGQQLILSAAVAAPRAVIDESYNVPQIAEHIDFINLMSYDYHFYISYYPVTDLNSPLFNYQNQERYLSELNVNYSANYWVEKGMPREKIVVGIPTYGHSYELINPSNHDLQAPAKGFGKLGNDGFVDYSAICNFLKSGAQYVFVTESNVPYAYKDNEWISYDDLASVTFKALWIKENKFKGAMIFSLNADDWNGTCSTNHTFPLIRSVNYVLSSS